MFLARFSVNNPVMINLIAATVFAAGIVFYFDMPREIFPEFSLDALTILTEYTGASSEEVEKLLTIKIEDEVSDLDGVDSIISESAEGLSIITVKLKSGADLNRAINDAKAAIDNIRDELPREIETPLVKELKSQFPVITVSVYGEINELALKEIAKKVRDDLVDIPGVGTVGSAGMRDREIWVEIEPETLIKYNLTIAEVKRAIEGRNLNLPGGVLKGEHGELLVRTVGEVNLARELEDIVVRSKDGIGYLYLGQVARVMDTFEEPKTIGRFNGRKAINLVVTKEKKGDAIKVAKKVKSFVEEYKKRLPSGVSIDVFNDFSVFVKERLNILKTNGIIGLALVMLTLWPLIHWRLALMVSLGIPFALIGAIILMHLYGITLNMISLFSLILVIGILVDDAIIVSENVYRHIEEGKSLKEAAVVGTAEVTKPVVAMILTNIAAFLPMLLMTGTTGKFMGVIPVVVTFAFAASLFEALFILPSHLADFGPKMTSKASNKAEPGLFDRVVRVYKRIVGAALNWRYVTLTMALALASIFVALIFFRLPFVMFEEFEMSQFFINVETPVSSKIEETSRIVQGLDRVVMALPKSEVRSLSTNIGLTFLDINRLERGANLAQLIVELTDADVRKRSSEEIIEELRRKTKSLPGISKIQFVRPHAGPGGPAIEIGIVGDELNVLQKIAEKIKSYLGNFPAAQDVRDDFRRGKKEIKVLAKEEARSFGLDVSSIAWQVRNSFSGAESSKIQKSDEEIPIIVKFPEKNRASIYDLERMKLAVPGGAKVEFAYVADAVEGEGYSKIIRQDKKRSITVLADVDQRRGNALAIMNSVAENFSDVKKRYPGYKLEFKGERKEVEESFQSLLKISGIALLLIYFILGSLFKSYAQPLIIMISIPFSAIGIVVGHIAMGRNLSLLSLLGLVALAGIVVNDSLVLIDFINRLRLRGAERIEAVLEACRTRFRPIILTTITTIAGLSSLAFFPRGQAKFLSPMAISLVWGLGFATVLTLIVVPCFYLVLDDLKSFIFRQGAAAAPIGG